MPSSSIDIWRVCQCYISDHSGLISDDIHAKVSGWVRSRSHVKLSSCSVLLENAKHTLADFRFAYQVESFFKKNSLFTIPDTARKNAVTAFRKAEQQCRETNLRLDTLCDQPLDEDLALWISRMQAFLDDLFGVFNTKKETRENGNLSFLEELPDLLVLTGGATATRSRRQADRTQKVRESLYCTNRSVPYVRACLQWHGAKHLDRLRLRNVNRIEFVPKSWKTERTIACEPDGTMPLQLAVDRWLKRRLRKFGVNLSDQGRNQSLAKLGSISGTLATIDLEAASDTLAFNTVALLLPVDWFEYLSALRCLGGYSESTGYIRYEKFSSMGNGSTFVLETAIFLAAVRAVGSKTYAVYGDDIIIETELVDDLIKLLGYLGFTVNQQKTHTSGKFRESCGASWYEGTNITPFYARNEVVLKTQQCLLINGMFERLPRAGGQLEDYLLECIEKNRLLIVPYNEDPCSGVWIDIHSAYQAKILRTNRRYSQWIPSFRSYVRRGNTVLTRQFGGRFLWFQDRNRRKEVADLAEWRNSAFSSRNGGLYRFRTQWKCMSFPAQSIPPHVYYVGLLLTLK